jgi:hypothetical protein
MFGLAGQYFNGHELSQTVQLSADGRYWRLVSASGAISLEQLGAIANDSTAGVVNVQAWTQAVAYLTAFYGGGIINCGAGTFTFDRATMGNSGCSWPVVSPFAGFVGRRFG